MVDHNSRVDPSDDYLAQADALGIVPRYTDTFGREHTLSRETYAALRDAILGGDSSRGPSGVPEIRVLRPGQSMRVESPSELILEDASAIRAEGSLPVDLPPGYHELVSLEGGRRTRIIKTPGSCYLSPGQQIWGWAVQLYALRSLRSWGMGDLDDLERACRWSAELGAGALLVNPLGAVAPVVPQQPSPYYPSSRRYLNPLYLSIHKVPGAEASGLDLAGLDARARALNARRQIDRDQVFRLKMEALALLWSRRKDSPDFERYRREMGESLESFATFCVLAERHGGDWREWPHEFRRPDGPHVAEFARQNADRVLFHQWLQWLLDEQLAAASRELPLVYDLPIGVDPGGADAWVWQDVLTSGAFVGAPPDQFNVKGQDWRLPPLVPHRLRAAFYRPFIETVRAALRHAGGLRVDHVMGLFRLYWIPAGCGPQDGAYVRYPADELLAILAVESHRANAWIAGEDLGTVEWEVRRKLAESQILTYRLLWFERAAPRDYPRMAMAAVTTHDLPTIAGLWSGSDVAAQQRLGMRPDHQSYEEIRRWLQAVTGLSDGAQSAEVVRKVHEVLGQAPSAVLVSSLDDALAVEERPNMPGTLQEWPNWSIALPISLEEITLAPLPCAIAASLRRGRAPS